MPLFSGLHGPAALLILAVGTLVCRADGPAEHVDPAAAISFERQVRPILKAYCLDCHGGEATEGGLDLRLRKFLIRGGQNGAAAVPGDVTASLILHRIQSGEMPPGEKKLPATDAAVLTQWIAAGAPTLRPEPDQIAPGVGISEEERSYWAFQPIRRPDVPAAEPSDRIRTPIDALFMQKMRPLGLKFSPDADRRVLIRRACLDLLGLPPTPEQIQAFIDDPSPQAWEHLVDRLLDSPPLRRTLGDDTGSMPPAMQIPKAPPMPTPNGIMHGATETTSSVPSSRTNQLIASSLNNSPAMNLPDPNPVTSHPNKSSCSPPPVF